MKDQQASFPLSEERIFKSDSLDEENLRFKVASLERELLKLKSQNSNLNKTIQQLLENQILELEQGDEFKEVNQVSKQLVPMATVSWGARYESRNPEVKEIRIPDFAEPDHVYTNDTLDIKIEKACGCEDLSRVSKKEVLATDDLITRKLVLTRERNIHFNCGSCGEKAHHKMIEKHIEAELYCKP